MHCGPSGSIEADMGATALIAGTALSAGSKIYGGMRQKEAMDQSASMMNTEATQSVASGIQGAIADRRRATYVASNARARTAASGLTTTGTTAEANVGNIRAQGEYNALTSLYQGQDRAQELNFRAGQLRNEGSASQTAGWIGGISSVLSGGTNFFDKYGAT
jgi:hypothetical protein